MQLKNYLLKFPFSFFFFFSCSMRAGDEDCGRARDPKRNLLASLSIQVFPSLGVHFHQNRMWTWMCLPDLENLTFSMLFFFFFLPNFVLISIPSRKAPILTKLGAFYNNLPKIPPTYVILAPSSLMKILWSFSQISRKSPKGRHISGYHVNERTPPPVPSESSS